MEYNYQGSMQEIMSRIELIKKNPTLIQRSIIDYLAEVTDGEVNIVDVTNPFVLLLEASSVNTAIAINHSDLNLRRQYAALSQTDEDIFRHMSDKEIMHRYSSPSSVEFTFMLPYDEFIKNMVEVPDQNHAKLTLARDTYIKVDNVEYTLSYPIDIRMYTTGGISVSYDTSVASPIENITTNNIMPQIKRMSDGTRIIYFRAKLKQLSLSSTQFPIEQKSIFKRNIAFKDKFFYARAYHKGSITGNNWVELNTTHTDQVYNIAKPTVCFKSLSGSLEVYIPHMYIINELIASTVRVDIYTTKGAMSVDYREHVSDSFGITMRVMDELDASIYTNAANNLTLRVISDTISDGGENGVTFDELRQRTVNHANGELVLPITNVQNKTATKNLGFDVVTNIDVVTNRVMLATRRLPVPSNKKLLTPVNIAVITTVLDSQKFIGNNNIKVNDTRTTIKPDNLYLNDNGVVKLVDPAEINRIKMLSPNEIVNEINSKKYLYTPFYYVLDYSGQEFDVRAYSLDNPKRDELNFIYQNDSMQMPVNSDTVLITKVDDGYEIYVKTKSGTFYKNAADGDVGLQIGYYPHNENALAYINAELYATNPDDEERIWKAKLLTNYDVDTKHCLGITNAKMYVDAPLITRIDLETELHLMHYTSSITNVYKGDDQDKYLGKFILTENDFLITHESIKVTLGHALDNLWRRSRSIPIGQDYKLHETDAVLTYEKDVYETDADGIKFSVVNGQIEYSLLHAQGDTVYLNGEIVYKNRIGDIYLDENGKPIIVNGIRQVQEVDILFVDGPMYFVTDEAMLGYKKQAYEIIKDWVVDDIALIEDDLLDKTSIYFYPETTLGKVDVYLSDNSETTIDAQQSFTIELYVDKAAYENETVRDVIRRATIAVLDKHVRSNEVNMGAVSNDLRAAYDTSVVTFVAKGLGGSVNYPIVRVKNGENRLCINKRAVAQPDGSIIIEDDVTLIFIPYNK